MDGSLRTLSLYWCEIQQIDGLVALISFLYLLVVFSWVGCTIVATCKLKFLELFSLTLHFCNSYHLLYGGSFLTSFSLFMLTLIKPDHFYQVRYDFWLIGNIFLTTSGPRVFLRREWVSVWALACCSSQVLQWFHTISKRNELWLWPL